MNGRKRRDLPAPLEGVRRRFEQWRRTHKAHARIPNRLWIAAVRMADTYGLHRTARALPIGYYSLKKRVGQSASAQGSHEASPGTAFLELAPSLPSAAYDCTLELEDTAGSKMRVHLKAASPPDLTALCRIFWNPVP